MEDKTNYFIYEKINDNCNSLPSLIFKNSEKNFKIASNESISTRKTCN